MEVARRAATGDRARRALPGAQPHRAHAAAQPAAAAPAGHRGLRARRPLPGRGEGFDVGGDFYDAFETRRRLGARGRRRLRQGPGGREPDVAGAVGSADRRGRRERALAGPRGHERGGPARAHRRPLPHGAVHDPRSGHRHARRGERGHPPLVVLRAGARWSSSSGAGRCSACWTTSPSRTPRSCWSPATPSSPTRTACSMPARPTGCWTPRPSPASPGNNGSPGGRARGGAGAHRPGGVGGLAPRRHRRARPAAGVRD